MLDSWHEVLYNTCQTKVSEEKYSLEVFLPGTFFMILPKNKGNSFVQTSGTDDACAAKNVALPCRKTAQEWRVI